MTAKQTPPDPADAKQAQIDSRRAEKDMEVLDIGNLRLQDFKAIPPHVAKAAHPFDGYPIKPPIKLGEYKDPKDGKTKNQMVSPTFIIALHPNFYVHQDISGRGVSIKDTKTKEERIVNLENPHSRMVESLEHGRQNIDVVFDRKHEVKGGQVYISVCPSHSARAQIFFKLDQEGKIVIDERYVLLDFDQRNALRNLFQLIHNPAARTERLARAISGESDETVDEVPATDLEQSVGGTA